MNPQDVAALTMLLSVLKQMSTWPFGVIIFAMVVGPWLFAFIFWRMDNRRFEKQEKSYRRELQEKEGVREKEITKVLDQYRQDVSEIKRLYESNSRLVLSTQQAFDRLEKIYSESIHIISLNTQSQTELVKTIENNQYCPIVRKKGGLEL